MGFSTDIVTASLFSLSACTDAPRKPVLELISQDDLVVNAKCRTIIGSYETSKTLWGIYLSTTYLDLFTINYNMEMDLRRSSDFRVKQIDGRVAETCAGYNYLSEFMG